MTYSSDFRRKVLTVREKEGLSIRVTAQRFDIGVATITRWLKRIEARPAKTRQRKLDKQALLEDVKRHPAAYQYESAARFGVSPKAIWQALKKLGVTYKKTLRHPKADQDARTTFQEKIQAYRVANKAIVFVDESGFAHDMPRTRGYAPRGARCLGIHDWQAKGRINVIGALLNQRLLTAH